MHRVMIQRFTKEKQILNDSIEEHNKAILEIQSIVDFKQKIGVMDNICNSRKDSEVRFFKQYWMAERNKLINQIITKRKE